MTPDIEKLAQDFAEKNRHNAASTDYWPLCAGFKAGYQAAQAEVEKLRRENDELREGLEDAIDGLACAHEVLEHCLSNECIPVALEVDSAESYLNEARGILVASEKEGRDE